MPILNKKAILQKQQSCLVLIKLCHKCLFLVPEKSEFQRVISPTEVKLFRYSALTYNCHRIHYDHNYATKVEGYPSILVHGPLTATFLIDLAARQFPKNPIKSFTYKVSL